MIWRTQNPQVSANPLSLQIPKYPKFKKKSEKNQLPLPPTPQIKEL